MRKYYVGLDVHSKKSAFVIEDEGGKVIARGEVPTTPEGFWGLQATYHLANGTQVALETGTVAFFVARQLGRLGLDPIVVDAHEVRLKAHRPNQKSDGRDAFELCEGLRRGIYRSIVHVPRPEISTPARHAFASSPLRAAAGSAGRCRQGVAARGGTPPDLEEHARAARLLLELRPGTGGILLGDPLSRW